ncbi:MAG: carbohydrate ABC transporter permease [Alicyclobacillus sp.]|nr:carbohydrate ABC transporter permease [Alicyclobacillus sp.]
MPSKQARRWWALYAKVRRFLLGSQGNDGVIFRIVVYILLISVGFVYLYPILYMVSQSMKSLDDLLDPTVMWIPKGFDLQNFIMSWHVLNYPKALLSSLLVSVFPAMAQAISCAFVGYGFAKFNFPGKNILFGLMLLSFIIPTQVVMIPLFIMFTKYSMVGTPLPFIIPAIFANGLKSALFILIYTQFFKSIPNALEEAAQIDGAGYFRIFLRIVLPISVPAIVVVLLFSFVWHWNETYMSSLYLSQSLYTLPLMLQQFANSFAHLYAGSAMSGGASGNQVSLNESIEMAGTLLTILPLLVLYLVAQKRFVEVVDRTGITGE